MQIEISVEIKLHEQKYQFIDEQNKLTKRLIKKSVVDTLHART